jgi:hypothetical protein
VLAALFSEGAWPSASSGKTHLRACGLPLAANFFQRESEVYDRLSIAGFAAEIVERPFDRVDAGDTHRQIYRQTVHSGVDGFGIGAGHHL